MASYGYAAIGVFSALFVIGTWVHPRTRRGWMTITGLVWMEQQLKRLGASGAIFYYEDRKR